MMPKSVVRDLYFSHSAFVVGRLLSGASPALVTGEVGVWRGVRGKPRLRWSRARWMARRQVADGAFSRRGHDAEFELGLKCFPMQEKNFNPSSNSMSQPCVCCLPPHHPPRP